MESLIAELREKSVQLRLEEKIENLTNWMEENDNLDAEIYEQEYKDLKKMFKIKEEL